MKKILFLLTSLLAVSSALFFTGYNTNKNGNGVLKEHSKDGIVAVEESDDGNDDTCPDCKKHGMPKVRFEFKDGRPARKH